jgi:hypothetical protein
MDPTGCPPNDIGALERVRYFDGMFLGIDDFEQEQTYFRTKARRHNRLLHGWGIVTGLEVSPLGSSGSQVSVAPGYALDPCGNEIMIEAPAIVDVPTEGEVALAVRFEECVVSEGRVRDSFAIQLLADPGEPWVGLAKITVDDQGAIAIDSSVRRRLSLD